MVNAKDYEKEILEKSKRMYEKSKLDKALSFGNKRLKNINKKMIFNRFLNRLEIQDNKGKNYEL